MTLIGLIVALVVIGVLLYVFNILVPLDGRIKQVIYVLVGLLVFLMVLQVFGVIGPFGNLNIRIQ